MTEKTSFIEWFADKLKVVGYPKLEDVVDERERYGPFNVIINVSDEFFMEYCCQVWNSGRQSYWFPMGEMHKDMGLISIFGALQVLYQSYIKKHSVLLHCHAGANRSPSVGTRLLFYDDGRTFKRYRNDRKRQIESWKHDAA